MIKKKIIKREDFFKMYLDNYREGAIEIGFSASQIDSITNHLKVYIKDIERVMRDNGYNFIQNEKPIKKKTCAICKKKIEKGLKIKDDYICENCLTEKKEEVLGVIVENA